MKLSKSFLFGAAVTLMLLPCSLSAITPEELADKILTARACHAPQLHVEKEPQEQGWFAAIRKNTGDAFRKVGDMLRSEGDQSPAGKVKELAKDGALAAVSPKLQAVKSKIFKPLGNALRAFGQEIKGGEATQTTTRIILDNIGLKRSAKTYQVEEALKTVAKATLKADEATAIEDYKSVVEGIVKRGYATKTQLQGIDVYAIYLNALAEEELNENKTLTYEAFSRALQLKGFSALENIKSVKTAPFAAEKLQAMEQYIKDAYNQIKLKQDFDAMRKQAISSPAA